MDSDNARQMIGQVRRGIYLPLCIALWNGPQCTLLSALLLEVNETAPSRSLDGPDVSFFDC